MIKKSSFLLKETYIHVPKVLGETERGSLLILS